MKNSKRIGRLALVWIIGSPARDYGWDVIFIAFVVRAEAGFQFTIFEGNHPGTSEDRHYREAEANHQTGAEAPRQHFQQMPQIDGMADVSANPADSERARWGVGHADFRQAAELRPAEACARAAVDLDSKGKEHGCREPSCRHVVDPSLPPRRCDQGDCDPKRNPQR